MRNKMVLIYYVLLQIIELKTVLKKAQFLY